MRRLVFKAVVLSGAFAVFVSSCLAYTYFLTENLHTPNWSNWTVTGTMTPEWYAAGNYGGIGDGSQGAMLSNYQSCNDVSVTVRGTSNSFSLYLAYNPFSSQVATYYWVNIVSNGSAIQLYKQYLDSHLNPQVVSLTGTAFNFGDNSIVRAVTRPDGAIQSATDVIIYVNNAEVVWYQDSPGLGPSGQAELLVYGTGNGSNLLSEINLGPYSTVSPNTIPASSISTSATSNQVSVSWPAGTESANGTGIWGYQLWRDGQVVTTTQGLSYIDTTVVPDTTYTYTLSVIDFHWNSAGTTVNVTTPNVPTNPPFPSATPDGRRVGVRPTGAYWGGGNENIDVLSGNLNFTLPLLKAIGRGSWGVPLNLVYNSQNWRQDSGGAWNFGADVGYGYGWKLLAGSITPVWNPGGLTASYYLYTDSNGTEYRLDQNTSNVWSSKESVYIWFDANANALHLRDGSFWDFACISAATEPDSGVMHPTLMESTNGNQIIIRYQTAPGANWANSSARITQIEDVRATSRNNGGYATYDFTYNTDPIPHLTSISNSINTGEAYSFNYDSGMAIASPINSQSFGTTTFLDHVTVTNLGMTHYFQQSSGGELTKILLPYGGYLAYAYGTTAYPSGTDYREVTTRYLSPDGTTGSQLSYPLVHETPVTGVVHQFTTIDDPSGSGEKYWAFGPSGLSMGLVTQYQGRQTPGGAAATQSDFTWTQDSTGNSYISNNVTTLDPGQSYQAQKATAQTVDIYGNVLQVLNYNFGPTTGSLARTYNYTYLYQNPNSGAYTAHYIYNRLVSATVTPAGGSAIALASNVYDAYGSGGLNGTCVQAVLAAAGTGVREWDSSFTTSYLTRGNVACTASPSGTSVINYDASGNVVSTTVNGVTAQVSSSISSNFATPSQLSVGSQTTTLGWSSFLGLTNETGPNGDTSSTFYDQYARPSNTTSPFGAVTANNYNSPPYSLSTPATVTTIIADTPAPPGSGYTTSSGRWTRKTLDGLGRTILAETGDSTGATKSQAESVYGPCACSPMGKLMKQAMPHIVGGTPAWTVYTYDGLGRTLSVLSPDGASTTTYVYQGNTVKVTDPALHWKIFTMDAFGNLIQVTEPSGE